MSFKYWSDGLPFADVEAEVTGFKYWADGRPLIFITLAAPNNAPDYLYSITSCEDIAPPLPTCKSATTCEDIPEAKPEACISITHCPQLGEAAPLMMVSATIMRDIPINNGGLFLVF